MDLYILLVQYQITTIYNYSTVSYMSWVVRFFIVLFKKNTKICSLFFLEDYKF